MSAAVAFETAETQETQELTTTVNRSETTEVIPPTHTSNGKFAKGNRANPYGARGKKIKEFQKLLNNEHLDIDKMRELFNRLRALAMGEIILVPVVTAQGTMEMVCKLEADARFMQLYLDRLLGPAKAIDEDMDLSDAPAEVIEYLRVKVSR